MKLAKKILFLYFLLDKTLLSYYIYTTLVSTSHKTCQIQSKEQFFTWVNGNTSQG